MIRERLFLKQSGFLVEWQQSVSSALVKMFGSDRLITPFARLRWEHALNGCQLTEKKLRGKLDRCLSTNRRGWVIVVECISDSADEDLQADQGLNPNVSYVFLSVCEFPAALAHVCCKRQTGRLSQCLGDTTWIEPLVPPPRTSQRNDSTKRTTNMCLEELVSRPKYLGTPAGCAGSRCLY